MKKLILLFLTALACAQTNVGRFLSGVNYVSGPSYTVQASDATKLIVISTGTAITLPSPLTNGFGAGQLFSFKNDGVPSVTITCAGCFIDAGTSVVLTQGQGADIYSDGGANYIQQSGAGTGGGGGGGIPSVNGTAGQIGVTNPTTNPVIFIQTNPILPGNVGVTGDLAVTGNLQISGSAILAFSKTLTGIQGNSGILASMGALSGGTNYFCNDANGNLTNSTLTCPAITAGAGGSNTQFQFNNLGALSGSGCTWNSGTSTITCPNMSATASLSVAGPYFVTSPFGAACVPSALGVTTLGVDNVGNVDISINGSPCGTISTSNAGGSVIINPISAQHVVQPVSAGSSTVFDANNFANIRYVTPTWNWLQTDSSGSIADLSSAGAGKTLNLTPCPVGIDTSLALVQLVTNGSISNGTAILTSSSNPFNHSMVGMQVTITGAGVAGATLQTTIISFQTTGQVTVADNASTTVTASATIKVSTYLYQVYIAGTGTPEPVTVTGGTCTSAATTGTVIVTTANTHSAGFTVGSATGGIQEAWNDAWVNDNGTAPVASSTTAPYVKLESNTLYNVYSTIYMRGRGGILDGNGSYISCSTRDTCLYIGTTRNSPQVNMHKVYNLSMGTTLNVDGAQITAAAAASGTYTLTTAGAHSFVPGDMLSCEIYSSTFNNLFSAPAVSPTSGTTITIQFNAATLASGSGTFGWCNIQNSAIEDNSDDVILRDIAIYPATPATGVFNWGIVDDNDQQMTLDHISNHDAGSIKNSANWPTGAFFWERTDQGNAGIMYIHNSEFNGTNCLVAGGNGVVYTDSVCQGFPVAGIRYFGGLQTGTFTNIYQESTGGTTNPLYGQAAQMGYLLQGFSTFDGQFNANGFMPNFACTAGSGTLYTFFVVPQNSGTYGPILTAGSANGTGAGCTPVDGGHPITVKWPDVQTGAAHTWDVLMTTTSAAVPPYAGAANSVTTNSTGVSCANGVCTYSYTGTGTSAYTVHNIGINPVFYFWPVDFALDHFSILNIDAWRDGQSMVASDGAAGATIIAKRCKSQGVAYQRSPHWDVCQASDGTSGGGTIAHVWQQTDQAGGGPPANSKGAFNLGKIPNVTPNGLITLADSNQPKTMATAGERPTMDAGDMTIAVDQTGGLAEQANTSISNYIGIVPDNATYLERLTGTLKSLNVPLRMPAGTAGAPSFGNAALGSAPTSGLYFPAAATMAWSAGSVEYFRWLNPSQNMANSVFLCWAATNTSTGTCDSTLSRNAAGVVQVNAGTGAGQTGTMLASRFMGGSGVPTCTFTSGGGTTPSCAVDTGSNDQAGIIIATTGTGAPAGTGTITLTFSATFGTNKPSCQYIASDNGAGAWQGLAVMKDKTPTTSSDLFTWTNGATPTTLSTSTAYWINYQCWAK